MKRWMYFSMCFSLAAACGDDGGGDKGAPDAGSDEGVEVAQAWTAVAAGGDHSCAIAPDSSVWCWGANDNGQIAQAAASSSPVKVAGLDNVVRISAGWKHTCAIQDAGQAYCWGANDLGQLGDNSTDVRAAPTMVMGLDDAEEIACGDAHSCAVRADGTVWCWGLNVDGQLGDGTEFDHIVPVQVSGLSDGSKIAASFANSCATTTAGKVYCWGENLSQQLGPNGGDDDFVTSPVEVPGVSGADSVACGDGHTCAVAGGEVLCWGENDGGQLGNGTTEETAMPQTVSGISGALGVAASIDHSCAYTSSEVYCWGANGENAALGSDFTANGKIAQSVDTVQSESPVVVAGVEGPVSLAAGDQFTCAATDGHGYCWGLNGDGQLGNGTTSPAFTASPVSAPAP